MQRDDGDVYGEVATMARERAASLGGGTATAIGGVIALKTLAVIIETLVAFARGKPVKCSVCQDTLTPDEFKSGKAKYTPRGTCHEKCESTTKV